MFQRLTRSIAGAAVIFIAGFVCHSSAQQQGPPAWMDADRTEPAGTRYRTFSSQLAGGEVSYLVYLPPDYQTNAARRYPVVYWLHGLNGTQRTGALFVTELDSAIRNGRAPAAIAVLVNGMRDSLYCDSRDGKWPVESVIIKELIPHVDRTYRTIPRREARAIEGYSMGGYGAARLAFKYPSIFGIVGIMAAGPLRDANSFASSRQVLFQKTFGGDNAYFEENSPLTLVSRNAGDIANKTKIRVAVGDQDPLQLGSQALHELMLQLKIPHEYEVVPGVAHSGAQFYRTLGPRSVEHLAQALSAVPQRPGGPQGMFERTSPPSRVLSRGGVEILTFETEQDYNRLQDLYAKTKDTTPEPGLLTPLYFRSRLDGSVQPYAIHLPRGYDPRTKYPLVVQLHGLNFKEIPAGVRTAYRGMRAQDWIEPNLPVIYAHGFGRSSTFYVGMGEEDILELADEVQRRFSADAERVFIMGHSMGGSGSYTIGLHYPDRFGGIMPTDAAMGGRLSPPANMPEWMKPQAAMQTVSQLFPNARNVDVFMKNAGAGIQGRSTDVSDGIVAAGGFSTSESFPGVPHNMTTFTFYASFVPQLIQHPIRRHPAEVKFYTNSVRYNRAYWVTIDRLVRHNSDALVTAAYRDGKQPGSAGGAVIAVSTTNISGLTLRLWETPAGKEPRVPLVVDGQRMHEGPLPATLQLARVEGSWRIGPVRSGSGLVKKHGLQGPIGDAFHSRFLAVYGEGSRDLAIAELDAIRNPPGPLIMHADFPMKPAAAVTREDIASSNLILFGTPDTNPLIKRMAASFPAGVPPEGVFIYPNPENPERYVVVWSAKILSSPYQGLRAGWIMPLNLLPDFIEVKDGKIARGGHFDGDWRLEVAKGR